MQTVNQKTFEGSGIHLSSGVIRRLEEETTNKERDLDEVPINDRGEDLPYITNGEIRVPLSGVADEFRWWDGRDESASYGLNDVMRFIGTPRIVWQKYSKTPIEAPECRGCEFISFVSENEAVGKCALGRKDGRFKACEPVCRIRDIEIQGGTNSGLGSQQEQEKGQEQEQEKGKKEVAPSPRTEAPRPVYSKAPQKDERVLVRRSRGPMRRTDRTQEKTSQKKPDAPKSASKMRRRKRKMKSLDELKREMGG